jgi:hypothetical protein
MSYHEGHHVDLPNGTDVSAAQNADLGPHIHCDVCGRSRSALGPLRGQPVSWIRNNHPAPGWWSSMVNGRRSDVCPGCMATAKVFHGLG